MYACTAYRTLYLYRHVPYPRVAAGHAALSGRLAPVAPQVTLCSLGRLIKRRESSLKLDRWYDHVSAAPYQKHTTVPASASQTSSGLLCSIVRPHMICGQLTYMYMIENEDDVRPMGVLEAAIEYLSCWS
jgi:hypothetical protein